MKEDGVKMQRDLANRAKNMRSATPFLSVQNKDAINLPKNIQYEIFVIKNFVVDFIIRNLQGAW